MMMTFTLQLNLSKYFCPTSPNIFVLMSSNNFNHHCLNIFGYLCWNISVPHCPNIFRWHCPNIFGYLNFFLHHCLNIFVYHCKIFLGTCVEISLSKYFQALGINIHLLALLFTYIWALLSNSFFLFFWGGGELLSKYSLVSLSNYFWVSLGK